eukprot:1145329-Pelagomonas_calceolata.AAC.1
MSGRPPQTVVVLDNGAGNCKIGFAGEAAPRRGPQGSMHVQTRKNKKGLEPRRLTATLAHPYALCRVFPNCVAKPKGERASYVGDMLLDCKEISQLNLRRPFDRGYLINWDLEREIWSRAFKAVLGMSLGGKGGLRCASILCLCLRWADGQRRGAQGTQTFNADGDLKGLRGGFEGCVQLQDPSALRSSELMELSLLITLLVQLQNSSKTTWKPPLSALPWMLIPGLELS